MATHDYVIANDSGGAVRSDINGALAAIVSNNSSAAEPATTYAYQWWADTNTNTLKIRNSANNGWITLRELDGTMLIEDGTAAAPGLAFADDVDTGIFSGAADQIGFATNGAERLEIGSSEVVFNDPSNDVDFRVESNNSTHMLFVDAGNDRVGIGVSAPGRALEVNSGTDDVVINAVSTDSGAYISFEDDSTTGDTYVRVGAVGDNLTFDAGNSEAARIDSDGRLLVGVSSAITTSTANFIQSAATTGAKIALGRSNDSIAANVTLGALRAFSNGGSTYEESAAIRVESDGAHAAGDKPGRIMFMTTASSASSSTERLRITSDGTIQLRNSPGIDFSQIQTNATGMTSETLDSYEEGTFTPAFAGASSAGTYTYATRTGHYTKIGEMVNVTVKLTNISTSTAGSGNINITGLPFTSANNSSFACGSVVLDQFNTLASTVSVSVRNDPNTAVLEILGSRDDLTDYGLDVTHKSSNSADIFCTITYRV